MKVFADKERCELHIKLLLHAARLDGKLLSSEEEYISALAKVYGIPPEFVQHENKKIEGEPTEFSNNLLASVGGALGEREKRCLLQDTISLSCADGSFDSKEIAFVRSLAEKLRVESSIVNKILELNEETMRVSKQLAEILLISPNSLRSDPHA